MMRRSILCGFWTLLVLLHAIYCGVQRSYDLLANEWLEPAADDGLDVVERVDLAKTRCK